MATKVPSDLEIAQSAKIRHINEIAAKAGIAVDDLEHYGKYKAKLPLTLINEEKIKKAKLVLVTAISPTPAGEGKTTTSIGLTEGMNRLYCVNHHSDLYSELKAVQPAVVIRR
jgi:formate--tetrahydrofolate ligase